MTGAELYEKGKGLFNTGKYAEAIECMYSAAEQGYLTAYFWLGSMYHEGIGVQKDLNKAFDLYMHAAKQGNVDGEFGVGLCYFYGDGVERDYEKAVEWYARAVAKNDPLAQHNLAMCYYKGNGVKRDYARAAELLTRAIEGGAKAANNELGACYYYGNGVERDEKKAFECFVAAAEAGVSVAQNNVAFCYEKGTGVEQDTAEAVRWYERAAKGGCVQAQSTLGMMYLDGEYVSCDKARAVELLTAAAKGDDTAALVNLGICYVRGDAVERDYAKAVEYFTRAVELGSASAAYNLGVCYERGNGVARDYDTAEKWYKRAAEQGYEYATDALEELAVARAAERERELGIAGSGERYDLFISWNHADLEFKNALVDGIEKYDYGSGGDGVRTRYRAWESDRDASGLIDECIENAVSRSKFFLVILSEHSIGSDWVKQEVGMALEKAERGGWSYDNVIAVYADADKCVRALGKITDENDPLFKLKTVTGKFAAAGNADKRLIEGVCEQIKNGLEADAVRRYAYMQTNADNTKFKFALTKQIDTAVRGLGEPTVAFLKTLMSIEDGYVERGFVDARGAEVSPAKVIRDERSFYLVGAGGTGKSLFITRLIYGNFSTRGNFFIRLNLRDYASSIESGYSVEWLLNTELNKYLASHEYHSQGVIGRARSTAKRVIIVADGMDEVTDGVTAQFIRAVEVHRNGHRGDRFIFTSRQPIGYGELSRIFGDDLELYSLAAFDERSCIRLFRAIAEASRAQLGMDEAAKVRLENEFFDRLSSLPDDIAKNPMLLSNLIFIYLKDGGRAFPSRKYDIIDRSATMFLKDLESERGVLDGFRYREYIAGGKLDRLLEFVAYKKCAGDGRSVESLILAFIKLKRLCSPDECETVSAAIYEYLRRRAVVTSDKITHDIFTTYFATRYIFGKIFERTENDDDREYVAFADGGEKYFTDRLQGTGDGSFAKDGAWAEIAAGLITKLDAEVYSCGGEEMNESSLSYAAFEKTLRLAIGERGFGVGAIEEIARLVDNGELYYGDFIKSFIKD